MKLFTFFLVLIISYNAKSQHPIYKIFDFTSFNKPLIKKTDTIRFLAKYKSLGKVSQREVLQLLHTKGLIDKKKYRTAVEFEPIENYGNLYLPYKDTDRVIDELLFKEQSQDKVIYITGIVYKGFEQVNNRPFFLIERIEFR